jgi:hypothetical protein
MTWHASADCARTSLSVVVESLLSGFACVESRSHNKSHSLALLLVYLKALGNTCLLIFDYRKDISAVVVVVGWLYRYFVLWKVLLALCN